MCISVFAFHLCSVLRRIVSSCHPAKSCRLWPVTVKHELIGCSGSLRHLSPSPRGQGHPEHGRSSHHVPVTVRGTATAHVYQDHVFIVGSMCFEPPWSSGSWRDSVFKCDGSSRAQRTKIYLCRNQTVTPREAQHCHIVD